MTNFTTGKHVLGTPSLGVINHDKVKTVDEVENENRMARDELQSNGRADQAKTSNADSSGV